MPRARRAAAIQRARRAAARVALFAASLTVTLLAAEWAVRKLLPQFDPSLQIRFEHDGDLTLGMPNSTARQTKNTGDYDVAVHFGPRGFRDRRDVARASPGDILVVGDSFAFGWGVEEEQRFSNRLEAALARRAFNIAIPGQNLDGYARLVQHAHDLGARADQLVLALCVETDVDTYSPAQPSERKETRSLSALLGALDDELIEHSALRELTAGAVHHTPWLERWAVEAGIVRPNLLGVGRDSFTRAEVEATADRTTAASAGYDVTVLIVPSRGLWLARSKRTERAMHDALVTALRARGLRVADPRAAFEATGTPLAMHFAKDGHWNARGHAIATQVLQAAMDGAVRQ